MNNPLLHSVVREDDWCGGAMAPSKLDDFRVFFSAKISRVETDTTEDFLVRPQDAQLGAVCFTSNTDLHATGAKESTSVFALGQNQSVKLPLPTATLQRNKSQKRVVDVVLPADTRINLTCTQHAVGIDGTLTTAMNGQASVPLKDIIKATGGGGAYSVGASYCGWKNIAATVTFSGCAVGVEPCLKKVMGSDCSGINLVFRDDPEKAGVMKDAYKLLEGLYDQAAQTRSEVVFGPAPNLTKPVMSVPFGINASKFDVSAAVCDRPQSFSDDAMESLLLGGLKSVCGFECEDEKMHNLIIDAFIKETTGPSIHLASRWAVVAGDTLSAANSVICPYRVDGRSVLLPTGGELLQSESWYAEAHRSARSADDCEGSGSLIVSVANRCSEIARDAKLGEQFPVLRGIGNALRHHVVGLVVMAANAGNADASGEDHSAVAGHAACFAISKPAFANAVKKGFECKLRDEGHDQSAITKASGALVCEVFNALYVNDRKDLPSTPVDERGITSTTAEDVSEKMLKLEDATATISPVFDHVAAGPLTALGLEGTAPVSPTLLYSADSDDRKARQQHARNDVRISELVKQNVARSVSVIDVDSKDYDKSKFYKSVVEFILPTSTGVCQSPKLRALGFASPHFVFSQTSCSGGAGCTPKEIALNDFKLTPLYTLDTAQGKLFDTARADVAANTVPMRSEKETLTKAELSSLKSNMENLKSLEELKIAESDRNHTTRSLITLASLTAEGGLAAFVDSLKKLKGEIGVTVDSHNLNGLLHDEAGESVGAFVCVNVSARVR